jgi:Outer membrane receptor proteins, mostly Fe transport
MKYLLLLIIILFSSYFLNAQEDKKGITAEFTKAKLTDFLLELEKQTNVYFYFDAAQTDSVFVTLSVQNQPLDKVLELAFNRTDFHFSADKEHHYFITKKISLVADLPASFYNPQATAFNPNTNINNLSIVNRKEKPKEAISENKLYEIGLKSNGFTSQNAVVTGIVRNSKTGEPLVNATIYVEKLQRGVMTDQYGSYSISLPAGNYLWSVYGIGMKDAHFQVSVYSEGTLNFELTEQVNTLKEVIVSTRKLVNINRVQMGVERLNIGTIKRVPTVFGEADVLKVILTLPGVKTVGEASSGFNVRGGSADQNLILLNDATIYNPSHFFGMFSAFNPEVLKDIQLYKSSIPAKFGGRLSSVLDITTREGNKKDYSGSAGIGIITTRINVEGPIVKDRTSFIFGARTTYAGWLLKLLPDQYKNSQAGFYDFNGSISHHIDAKNDLYLTGYLSHDHFNLSTDTTYGYDNRNVNLKWKHAFRNTLNAVFTTGYDSYSYNISSEMNKVNAYKLDFTIQQANLKSDFNLYINSKHSLDFGAGTILYKLHPGTYQPVGKQSLVTPDVIPAEQALESSVYISDKFNVSPAFSLETGTRLSIYNYLGPQTVNIYAAGLPRDEANQIGTKYYSSGKNIKTYLGPEVRVSARYAFSQTFSVKAGYNIMHQYIHMLSNTTAIAPTDIWKLSDPNIKPQEGDQVSLGLYKNLKSNTIETSVEAYYKRLKNYLDYKPGATLVLNHAIETDVLNTNGKAYGIELMIKKESGKLNGWIGYTYSRILLKMDDSAQGAPVNHGQYYPANYDKPHDVIVVGNFKVNHRLSLSLNMNYSTGRPITLPIARYYYMNSQRVLYSDRNQYRIPDYFRTDFSMNIDGNHKVKQKTHNSWTIGVYNLTGRKNPYTVYFVSENGVINGYKVSIFGSAIPFINFNIRF